MQTPQVNLSPGPEIDPGISEGEVGLDLAPAVTDSDRPVVKRRKISTG